MNRILNHFRKYWQVYKEIVREVRTKRKKSDVNIFKKMGLLDCDGNLKMARIVFTFGIAFIIAITPLCWSIHLQANTKPLTFADELPYIATPVVVLIWLGFCFLLKR